MFVNCFKKRTYISLNLQKTIPCLDSRSATEIYVTDANMLFEVGPSVLKVVIEILSEMCL